MSARDTSSSSDMDSSPPSSPSSSSSSSPPSPPPPSAPPPSPRKLISELCTLPIVSSVCEKVSVFHSKLSRVLPFYAMVVGGGLAGAATVVRRISRWDLVRTSVERLEKTGLWALDTARGKWLRPKHLVQKVSSRVQEKVAGAATRMTSHPVARRPWRMTLTVTSKTCHFLEALKLHEDRTCLGEVFIIGRLQQVYNSTLTTLTVRLKSCHCMLQGLQVPEENGTSHLKTCTENEKAVCVENKRDWLAWLAPFVARWLPSRCSHPSPCSLGDGKSSKKTAGSQKRKRPHENDGSQSSESSSDDEEAVQTENCLNGPADATEGVQETSDSPPVTVAVTHHE